MATLSGYTSGEILAMQNDAVRRVREMQRIAKERVVQSGGITPTEEPLNSSIRAPVADTQNIEHCQAQIIDNGFTGMLQRLNLDDEKILIILLGIILINEGADIMLILALGYLLLG